jgi:hypothetical protein
MSNGPDVQINISIASSSHLGSSRLKAKLKFTGHIHYTEAELALRAIVMHYLLMQQCQSRL